MKGELKQIDCDDGFLIRSRDEKEVMKAAKSHVKEFHHMNLAEKDLKSKMTMV